MNCLIEGCTCRGVGDHTPFCPTHLRLIPDTERRGLAEADPGSATWLYRAHRCRRAARIMLARRHCYHGDAVPLADRDRVYARMLDLIDAEELPELARMAARAFEEAEGLCEASA